MVRRNPDCTFGRHARPKFGATFPHFVSYPGLFESYAEYFAMTPGLPMVRVNMLHDCPCGPRPTPETPHRSVSVAFDHVLVLPVNGSWTSQRRPPLRVSVGDMRH